MPDIEKELTRVITEEELERMELRKRGYFLTGLKFWRNRIKFDTPLMYIYFILWVIPIICIWIMASGAPIDAASYTMQGSMWITLFIFSIYLGKRVPHKFQELILNSRTMFEDDEAYNSYIIFITNSFKSKTEKILPLLLGISLCALYIVGIGMMTGYDSYQDLTIVPLPEELIIFNMMQNIVNGFQLFFMAINMVSTLLILLSTFKCIKMLGVSPYNLRVNYKDLRIGAFNDVGKFILSIAIPALILSTTFSIMGLVMTVVFNSAIIGMTEMIVGLVIVVFMSYLLYNNTIHIHNSITEYKKEISNSIIDRIQILLEKPPMEIDYDKIYEIHAFYHDITDINDWPFNPASIKKLLITLGSSLIPILLSLTQLGGFL